MAKKGTSRAKRAGKKTPSSHRVSYGALRKQLKPKIKKLTEIQKAGGSSAKLKKTLTVMEELEALISDCQTTMTITYP